MSNESELKEDEIEEEQEVEVPHDIERLSSKEQDDQLFEVQGRTFQDLPEDVNDDLLAAALASSEAARNALDVVDQRLEEVHEIEWLPAEDSDVEYCSDVDFLELFEVDDDLTLKFHPWLHHPSEERPEYTEETEGQGLLDSVHWSKDHAEVNVKLMLDDCEMAWQIVLDMDAQDAHEETDLIVDSEDEVATPTDKNSTTTGVHANEQEGLSKQVETLKQQIQALKDQHETLSEELDRSRAEGSPKQANEEEGEDCSELVFGPCGAWDSPMSRDEKIMLSLMMSEREECYDPAVVEQISSYVAECFPISWDFPLSRREKMQRLQSAVF